MTLLAIAAHQVRTQWRQGRLQLAALTLTLVLGGALLAAAETQAEQSAQLAAAQQAERSRWLDQGRKNPHAAAHWGLYAFRPRQSWTVLDPGVDAYQGVAVWIEAHKQNPPQFRAADDEAGLRRLGELTCAFGLQVLVPLVILLLTFDAFSGEREQGTLQALLSLGISELSIALGKALGTGVGVVLVVLPTTVLGVAMTTLGQGLQPGSWQRGLALLLLYAVYQAIFVGLGLSISRFQPTSRRALVLAVALWFGGCLLLPRGAGELCQRLYPTPPVSHFNQQLEHSLEVGLQGDSSPEDRRRRLQQSGDQRPLALQGRWLQAEEEHGYPVFDHYYGSLRARHRAQNQLYDQMGCLFPSLACSSLSMALAGSDLEHSWHFQQAAETYRRAMVTLMNRALIEHAGAEDFQADRDLWSRLPPFHYVAPSAGWALEHRGRALVPLLLWLLLAWAPVFWPGARP